MQELLSDTQERHTGSFLIDAFEAQIKQSRTLDVDGYTVWRKPRGAAPGLRVNFETGHAVAWLADGREFESTCETSPALAGMRALTLVENR